MNTMTRQQKWYWKNRERMLERSRQYRQDNREACRKRCREYMRARRISDPELYRSWQVARYGITLDQCKAILKAQHGVCAICNRPESKKRRDGSVFDLAIDHDHKTGKVRGLLCARCNSMLGWFEKHSNDAAQYLNGSAWKQTGL